MRLRLEVEFAWRPLAAHFDVLGLPSPFRDSCVRQVRQRQQHHISLLLDAFQLHFELLDALAACLVRGEQRRRVLPLALRPRRFAGRGVLFALEAFDLRDQSPPVGIELSELVQLGVGLQSAGLQRAPDVIDPVADNGRVEHL